MSEFIKNILRKMKIKSEKKRKKINLKLKNKIKEENNQFIVKKQGEGKNRG